MSLIYNTAMFIALWIGLASILAAWETARTYWPRARLFLKSPDGRDFTGFLIAGVVVVVVGNLLGNVYWQSFWLLEWYGWKGSALVQDIGLGVNSVFRNGGLLLGSYLFYRAFLTAHPKREGEQANRFTLKTVGLGFGLAVILMGGAFLL